MPLIVANLLTSKLLMDLNIFPFLRFHFKVQIRLSFCSVSDKKLEVLAVLKSFDAAKHVFTDEQFENTKF